MDARARAEKNLIVKMITGSHMYGTSTQDSDKDYTGLFVPAKDYVLGLYDCERVESRTNSAASGMRNTKEDVDSTLYSVPKFIKLAMQGNPNIIELFFVPATSVIHETKWGEKLLRAAPLFISKRVKHTFLGYAYSQKQKLLHKNYEGGRLAIVEKYGYDTKFASHLIRLLTEGIQLLTEGRITLPLPNRQYIHDIKIGGHSLDNVLAEATRYEALVEEACMKSSLQHSPDIAAINDLQMELLQDFWNDGGIGHGT